MRILILGGTSEARDLAQKLAPAHQVITSLAGRTTSPHAIDGAVLDTGSPDGYVRTLRKLLEM